MSPYLKGLLFLFGVIILSLLLDRLNLTDRDLSAGQCIEIYIGNNQKIDGQIFNLRADGRYTVYYSTDRSQIHTITLKRFQFKAVECKQDLPNLPKLPEIVL